MPEAALRPCAQAGCGAYAAVRGRCTEHAQQLEKRRGTTKQRGYAGGIGGDWRKVRLRVLERDNYECKIQLLCGHGAGRKEGDYATEVDHIIPVSQRPDLRVNMSNLQAACASCNAAKGNRVQ